MSANNTVMLVGHVTRDPEARGKTFTVGIAIKRAGKTTKEDGFFNLTVFEGRLYDLVKQYVVKGKQIAVTGRLRYNRVEKEGESVRIYTDIIADDIQLLSSGKKDDAAEGPSETLSIPAADESLEEAFRQGL